MVGLSACFSRADDIITADNEFVSSSLTLDDLDPQARETVLDLAALLSGGDRSTVGDSTLESNVEAILNLLQSVSLGTGFRTIPFSSNRDLSLSLGAYLRQLGEDWTIQTIYPETGYLRQIQRALYGQSGIPSSSDSIIPILRVLRDASTNDLYSALLQSGFGSVTNDTQHLVSVLSNVHDSLISGFYENNWYLANSYWKLMDIYSNLTSFVEYVDQSQNSNGSFFPGVGPHVRVIDPVLFQVYETGRLMTTGEESTWLRVKDYDLLYELLQLNSALHALTDFSTNGIPSTNELANAHTLRRLLAEVEDFHSDYLSYTYLENDYWEQLLYDNLGYPSGGYRTLSTDMVDLQNALFGNETAQGTNNILSVLKSISTTLNDTTDFSVIATNELALTGQAMTNALNAIDASESNVTAYAENPDNEPPYDDDQYKYDGNPLDEFSSQFAAVPLQWTQLYRGAENAASTVTGIELYRGAFPIYGGSSGNRALAQRTVNLPIYYELRDNEPAVAGVMNTTHDIMGWVWDVAAAFLIGWLYKRFAEYMSSQSLT